MHNLKTILSIIFLITTLSVFSQFSVKTELKYLQIINNQANTDLISDNLYNAELVVDSLLLSTDNSITKSEFLFELSKSYYLTKKYDLALFSLLRQRCIFPNKIIQKQSENLFIEATYSNDIGDSLSNILFKKTDIKNLPSKRNERFNLLLKMSISINTKKLSKYIYRTGLVYRSIENKIPYWYQHWEFLTIINLKPKKINEALAFAKTDDVIYKQVEDQKLKYKIYRKTIKHYHKNKSCKTAKNILDEYKENKLNIFLRIDAIYKSICLNKLFR